MDESRAIESVSRVLLYPREDGPVAWPAVEEASHWLASRGVATVVPPPVAESRGAALPSACEAVPLSRLSSCGRIDLAIALGGDGTFLRASRWVASDGVPVMGVNLGELGFFSSYGADELAVCLQDAVDGKLVWEPRMRARVDVVREGELLATETACNDAYVKHGEIPRLLRLATRVRGELLANYRADGLIVCTPLGSTGYNLAAGGPITEPGSDNFTITPLCSHSLTDRAVVTSADATIEIVYRGPRDNSSAVLTVDGQWNLSLALGDTVRIRKAATSLKMVPPRNGPFAVLAHKLGWGGPSGLGSPVD
ncbi:MAG: NAD(+)/NADH kinase [Myxococcales bacterium FL481]|nr:MAG: NAD(+)/NADH kinase [Myxococcales bacterium FL481]